MCKTKQDRYIILDSLTDSVEIQWCTVSITFPKKQKNTSHSQISFCIRSPEVWYCRRPNRLLAAMSIMDWVTRHIFSVLSTIVIDESENRPSAGGLEHDMEIPRPSTLADISTKLYSLKRHFDGRRNENVISTITSRVEFEHWHQQFNYWQSTDIMSINSSNKSQLNSTPSFL